MVTVSEPRRCPKCGWPIPAEAPQALCPKCLLQQASVPTEAGQGETHHSTPPTIGDLAVAFPGLQILGLVGQGGMGFVFKARQPNLDRLVALKILPASLAIDPAFAERFTREARLLARLNHPNIVTIHDFGQVGPFFYLIMEFVDGVNLRQAMQVGRFTPAQALSVVPKICDALQFAHNEGILHRDIKPANILLDSKGRVKIADFGIAKLLEPGPTKTRTAQDSSAEIAGAAEKAIAPCPPALTEAGKVLGTPQYMAPEQLEHPQDVDQRADIYSLGVVFYEMLTGELPLGRFAPPSEKSGVDRRVDEIVLRALEKERERRTRTASEVKTQVETVSQSYESQPPERPPMHDSGGTTPRRPSTSRIGIGLAVGAVVFLSTLVTANLVTFIMPETYSATARIKVEQVAPTGTELTVAYDPHIIQTEIEVIQSSFVVLSKVIQELKLDERWGRDFGSEKVQLAQTISLLKSGLEVRAVRNTQLLEIRFFSRSRSETAEIANAVAESYKAYNTERLDAFGRERQSPNANPGAFSPVHSLVHVELVDRAVPPLRPSRPNKALNIVIGGAIGSALGALAAAIIALFPSFKAAKSGPASN